MKTAFAALSAILLVFAASAAYIPPVKNEITPKDQTTAVSAANLYGAPSIGADDFLLIVLVREQRMIFSRNGEVLAAYTISTAKAGVGALQNSGKTPPGWHVVREWIGGNALPGQVFVSREPTSEIIPYTQWKSDAAADKVLTRVMWLDGLEPGRNRGGSVDSHSRFIYIHGTNQEHLLGKPASHGCIRMFNQDVVELFDKTKGQRTFCLIVEG